MRHSIAAAVLAIGVAAAAGCGSPETAQSGSSSVSVSPSAPPTGVSWATYQGMTVPCADQGPQQCWAPAPTGFRHTGAGAALAAISGTIRMSVADDAQWPLVVGTLVEPSAARDEWAVNRAQVSITAPVKAEQAPVLVGYTVDQYSPSAATIGIVTRQHDRSLTRNTATVVWSAANDWVLRLPDRSDTTNRVAALSALPSGLIPLAPKAQ